MANNPCIARYVGYARSTQNHGDEALFRLIDERLRPEIRIDQEARDIELAVLGGGTLINQSPWLIDEFASSLDRAGRGVVVGSGVGHPSFWGDHFDRWKPLLDRCECVGVRGPLSLELLREHGISCAQWIGDPYLSIRHIDAGEPTPKTLGVNIGSTNDSHWGGTDADLQAFAADVLSQLKSRGWRFRWICVWEKDRPLLDALREAVDRDSSPVVDARAETRATYAALAECELFLGEKLHANAMAAVAGTPFLSLEYQPKVRDFAASLNMEDWVVRTDVRDAGFVVDRIEAMRARRGSIAQAMIENREKVRRRLSEFFARVKSLAAPEAEPK